jgi:hypothetical protein
MLERLELIFLAVLRRFFDLQNQVQLDSAKLEKIGQYEARCVAVKPPIMIRR